MAGGVTRSQMLDLLKASTEALPKNKVVFSLNKQRYEVCNRWWKEDKIETKGGNRVEERIILDESGAARHVRPYEPDNPNTPQLMSRMFVDWVFARTLWNVETSEVAMNASGESARLWAKGFVDLVDKRRKQAMIELCDEIEDKAWQVPTVDTDNLTPLGIPYWIPQLAAGQAATAAGFYGGRYSTALFTNVGGIAPATADDNTTAISGGKAKWRSYQCGYTTVNEAFIKQMALMFYMISFQAPLLLGQLTDDKDQSSQFRIYAAADDIVECESYARAQNDNLGGNLLNYQGATFFKRVPLIHTPALDSHAAGALGLYHPFYMLNHDTFKVYVNRDMNLVESEAMNDRIQHQVYTTFVDVMYAYMMTNRRLNGVCNRTA